MPQPIRRTTAVKWLSLCAQCGLGILLLWWIITSGNIDVKQLLQRLATASLLPLMLGTLSYAAAMGLGALRYRIFLPRAIPLRYLVGITLLQSSLLTLLPWRVGEVSYPILLRRDYDVSLASSSAVILAVRLVDLAVISAVAFFGSARLGLNMRGVGIVLGATSVTAILAFLILQARWDVKPVLLRRFQSALQPLRKPQCLAGFLFFSLTIFALTTCQSALILRAMALSITVLDVALLNAITLVTALLPIHAPAGWGTMDSIQIALLAVVGYPASETIAAILTAHTFYTFLVIAGGVIGWMIYRTRRPK